MSFFKKLKEKIGEKAIEKDYDVNKSLDNKESEVLNPQNYSIQDEETQTVSETSEDFQENIVENINSNVIDIENETSVELDEVSYAENYQVNRSENEKKSFFKKFFDKTTDAVKTTFGYEKIKEGLSFIWDIAWIPLGLGFIMQMLYTEKSKRVHFYFNFISTIWERNLIL